MVSFGLGRTSLSQWFFRTNFVPFWKRKCVNFFSTFQFFFNFKTQKFLFGKIHQSFNLTELEKKKECVTLEKFDVNSQQSGWCEFTSIFKKLWNLPQVGGDLNVGPNWPIGQYFKRKLIARKLVGYPIETRVVTSVGQLRGSTGWNHRF